MKQWLKRVTGIEAKEKELDEKENKVLSKADPKALANKRKQPYIEVIDMQVNKDNIRNGSIDIA